MKRALTVSALVILFAAFAAAADLTGTWKGAFDFNGTSIPLTFTLKADGDVLTGTVDGLPTPAAEIKDGKIKGEAITFWLMIEYQGSPVKLVYEGKNSGDEIHFTFGTDDGSWSTALVVKRSS